MAQVTPKVTTARSALIQRLEGINGTGSYNYAPRVKEGYDQRWIDAMGPGDAVLFLTRTTIENTGRYTGATARRVAVEFTVRGYVHGASNRDGIEKLEHDVWRCVVTSGSLATGVDVPRMESAEIADDEFETDDGKIARSYVEIRFRCEMSESI